MHFVRANHSAVIKLAQNSQDYASLREVFRAAAAASDTPSASDKCARLFAKTENETRVIEYQNGGALNWE
jgi:hypothetical protein